MTTKSGMSELDSQMMAEALEAGRQGDPSPNPHVGCVIGLDGEVIARGHHEAAGKDHAEVAALKMAGDKTQGATLYVTLEPCNHQGRTPPCTEAIIQAGIKRVVIGCKDPNPHVSGSGIEALEQAGIEVVLGIREDEAKALIRPWKKYITSGRSFVSLKLAVSLDGRIATKTGASKWVTCSESRARVHALRTVRDAVMVGINTALADDPRLTVRDVQGRNPVRVVIDSKLRIPLESQLVTTAEEVPTCVVTTTEASEESGHLLEDRGVAIVRVPPTAEGRVDMAAALKELAVREVVSVLCEGGAELSGSLLALRLADELHCFVAPVLLGPRGKPGAVDWAGPEHPSDAPRIESPRWELCGSDAYVYGQLRYPKKKRAG